MVSSRFSRVLRSPGGKSRTKTLARHGFIGDASTTHCAREHEDDHDDEPMKRIEVAAGLVFRNGRVLIAQRPRGVHLAGLWEFPGGKREESENLEECLERELWEELRIRVKVLSLFESITHDYPDKHVRLQFFHCHWSEHEPQALGCADFAWVTRAEFEAYAFPPADAQLIARLMASEELWRA